ncbi:winged helix-turn-helix transcriptional regulator [Saccharolobus solfataricus]|uniref:Winged helix-turn-helix transcriptional regulator n=1 Tax=Saccharolobus solfataricus TaxID=2287 RepID=A0A7S9IHG8_SACSO|nr:MULTISPECIES: winged helix-turn-helix domain-containing protein [Sulfolobaceae]QPG49206.1 winged helix-turn-helix transcriptional regulator [Saccharolobus solfataricus]
MLLDRVKVLVLIFLYVKGPLSFTELLNMINEVNELTKKERITKGNLDSHIKVMLNNGLIERRESFYFITGKKVIYKITEKGKEELFNTIKELEYIRDLIKENKK